MKAYFLAGAGPILMDGSSLSITTPSSCGFGPRRWMYRRSRSRGRRLVAAVNGRQQNHYAVLGVSDRASSADIKRAYRLLARKYHPDVSKEAQAGEIFKSIHHAYEVLSDDLMRAQYDRSLFEVDTGRSWTVNRKYYPGYEDGLRIYRWAELRRRMQHERYWEDYDLNGSGPSDGETDEVRDEEASHEERGSFIEVLRSAFVSLFLMQALGCRLSLTFSSLTALLDRKLDAGYKLGYMIAWILGGRGGILLTMCLSFASWVCGKTSSGIVVLVVVAMWVGSNLARDPDDRTDIVITLHGDVIPVAEADKESTRSAYLRRHPNAFWVDFGDFKFVHIKPKVVRCVSGIATALLESGEFNQEEYQAAKVDPIAQFSRRVASHMNKDHAEDTKSIVQHTTSIPVDFAYILDLDSLGFDVKAGYQGSTFKLRVPFPRRAEDRKDVKKLIVEMLQGAAKDSS